jgi:hypothetical protein
MAITLSLATLIKARNKIDPRSLDRVLCELSSSTVRRNPIFPYSRGKTPQTALYLASEGRFNWKASGIPFTYPTTIQ